MKTYLRGLIAGLLLGFLIGILATQFGPVDYKIETLATTNGITYFVTYDTWSRADLLFMTDDPNFAWTMWYYLKAQNGDVDLEEFFTPDAQDGVYNPDDLARKNGNNSDAKN